MSAIFITTYSKHPLCSFIFQTKGWEVSRPALRKDISQILWKAAGVRWELLSGCLCSHPRAFCSGTNSSWAEMLVDGGTPHPTDLTAVWSLIFKNPLEKLHNPPGKQWSGAHAKPWKCWVLWVGKIILIQVLGIPEYRSIFPLTCSFKAVPLHKSSY